MTIGILAITISFIAALVSTTAYILYYRDRVENVLNLANRSFYVMGGAIIFSILLLIHAIMTHNFQLNYVYSYSSRILNKFYLFSTLWAGQEGTLLLWVFFGAIFGFVLIQSTARKQPLVMAMLTLVQLFILLILMKKSPFSMIWHAHQEVPVGFTPADGAGLNPLLQNPWMVLHPPTLFVGYSSAVIPFAFAISAMITRNMHGWIKPARPWVLFNVLFLGAGLIMGGYWAYTTLGWGGYWGWDPVENASLVPWLLGLALLHGLIIQGRRRALVKSNFFLAGAIFITVLWGSFLTRSGILTDFSVHSFGASGLNLYLILFQALSIGLFFVPFFNFIRYQKDAQIQIEKFGSSLFNRETFILAGMMALFLMALIVFFGTSAPIYMSWFGTPSNVSPDFYNQMIIPIAIFILLTITFAPLLDWKDSEFRNLKVLGLSAAGALLATIFAFLLGVHSTHLILLVFLSAFVVIVSIKVGYSFYKRNLVRVGGALAHAGVALMVIGIITSSVYDTTEKLMLPRGEFQKTDLGYELKFIKFIEMPDGRDRVKLAVRNNKKLSYAYPRFFYSDYSKSYMISPDVTMQLTKDIYISPASFTPAKYANQRRIELGKTQSKSIDDLQITFNNFLVNMGGNNQEVTADLTVKVKDGDTVQEYAVNPRLKSQNGTTVGNEVEIPNSDYRIKMTSVNPSAGKVELALLNASRKEKQAKDMLAVEVSVKPLIGVLWLGTLCILGGVLLSMVSRIRKKS